MENIPGRVFPLLGLDIVLHPRPLIGQLSRDDVRMTLMTVRVGGVEEAYSALCQGDWPRPRPMAAVTFTLGAGAGA